MPIKKNTLNLSTPERAMVGYELGRLWEIAQTGQLDVPDKDSLTPDQRTAASKSMLAVLSHIPGASLTLDQRNHIAATVSVRPVWGTSDNLIGRAVYAETFPRSQKSGSRRTSWISIRFPDDYQEREAPTNIVFGRHDGLQKTELVINTTVNGDFLRGTFHLRNAGEANFCDFAMGFNPDGSLRNGDPREAGYYRAVVESIPVAHVISEMLKPVPDVTDYTITPRLILRQMLGASNAKD